MHRCSERRSCPERWHATALSDCDRWWMGWSSARGTACSRSAAADELDPVLRRPVARRLHRRARRRAGLAVELRRLGGGGGGGGGGDRGRLRALLRGGRRGRDGLGDVRVPARRRVRALALRGDGE